MTTLLAFSAEHVCRLTGLSMRQLFYWDRIGFFAPQYVDENRRRPYSRVYSFRDVVGLRTLALLRNGYGVSLQELRQVGRWLAEHYKDPWASLTFYVGGDHVFFEDPRTGARMAGRPSGQTVLPIDMQTIAHEVEEAANHLRQRSRDDIGRVSRHRYVAHNAPVIAGTRIPTEAIWNFHAAGYDTEAIIREYPTITPDDVYAAISYEESRRQKRAG